MKHAALRIQQFLLLVFACSLIACAQLGLPTAQTANERIAVAQASVTQVRASARQLLTAKRISSADAENVLKQTDTANEGVTLATQLSASDPAGATTKLQSATAILQVLQAYLAAKEKP